jgi:pyruvate/2-oxoglutarate dehydrogenase complex dihydrolipoamide acyltransferase (E2) component
MTRTKKILEQLRQRGIKGTYTHIVIRALALAFKRHPELNRLFIGKRVVYLDSVDIGLSVSSPLSTLGNPTMVVQNAEQKDLEQIALEVIRRASEVRKEHYALQEKTRMAARIVPGWARRLLFRTMLAKVPFVKKKIGTFYVTTVPHLQCVIPFIYPCSGVIVINQVEDRVVAKDGQPVVRPMLTLGNVGDRRLWTGNSAGLLLNEIKKILEDGELAEEVASSSCAVAVP